MMKPFHHPGKAGPWTAALYAFCVILLAGCQVLGPRTTRVAGQAGQRPTNPPAPTRTPRPLDPLPATYTPAPVQAAASPTPVALLPDLLAGFPLFEGEKLDPAGTVTSPTGAEITLETSKNPGELSAFYRKALESAGWTLRYSEGNVVGGFVQEWKKENTYLTVEYHFPASKAVVSADTRVIDPKLALVPLSGFLLPVGTEVVRKVGPTVELDIPEDLDTALEDFKTEVASLNWRMEKMKPTNWCGSRGCQETLPDSSPQLAALEPIPTPDERKPAYYRLTMPDRTQVEFTFLPRRDHTRVLVTVNFRDFRRSGMPVTPYPKATITGVMPGVAMFEVKADIKDVIKFYEDGLAWLNWEALQFTINTPEMYTRSWRKSPGRVVTLSLSTAKGIVYGQLNCVQCSDPYFVIPTTTPTVAPSK